MPTPDQAPPLTPPDQIAAQQASAGLGERAMARARDVLTHPEFLPAATRVGRATLEGLQITQPHPETGQLTYNHAGFKAAKEDPRAALVSIGLHTGKATAKEVGRHVAKRVSAKVSGKTY